MKKEIVANVSEETKVGLTNEETKALAEEIVAEGNKVSIKPTVFVALGANGTVNQNTMFIAIKDNLQNAKALQELYTIYKDVFIGTCKYFSNNQKVLILAAIKEIDNEFTLEIKPTKQKQTTTTNNEEKQMLITIFNNIANQDTLNKLKNDFPELFAKAIKFGTEKLKELE